MHMGLLSGSSPALVCPVPTRARGGGLNEIISFCLSLVPTRTRGGREKRLRKKFPKRLAPTHTRGRLCRAKRHDAKN